MSSLSLPSPRLSIGPAAGSSVASCRACGVAALARLATGRGARTPGRLGHSRSSSGHVARTASSRGGGAGIAGLDAWWRCGGGGHVGEARGVADDEDVGRRSPGGRVADGDDLWGDGAMEVGWPEDGAVGLEGEAGGGVTASQGGGQRPGGGSRGGGGRGEVLEATAACEMWRRRAVRCGLWRRRRAVARRAAEAGACSWRRHLPAVAVPEPLQMAAALVPSEVAHADFLAGQRHLLTNIHRRHGRRGSSTSPLSGGGHEREVETLRRHRDALAWLRREQEPRGQLLDMECRVRGTERRHEQCTASSHTACTAAVYSAAICIVQGRVDDESGGRTVYLASSFSPV